MADEISLSRGWTLEAYVAHNEAMRIKDAEKDGLHEKYLNERDRRYSEVKQAEEKALKIKEEADKTALGLQRDNQQYRDEKGNELRAQIEAERGTYITRTEFKPISDYVTAQSGPRAITPGTVTSLLAALAIIATLIVAADKFSNSSSGHVPTVTVTVPK